MQCWRWPSLIVGILWFILSSVTFDSISAIRTYDEKRLIELREEVRSVFYHGYDSYIRYAYPYDELRPLSCDGVDTWGSYSLTLIDTLDTLAVMGNYSEFRRVAQLIMDNAHFDLNINVSVFETNIRIIGGLLSAHLLSHKAGMEVEVGWPCTGKLLRLAEVVARKLLPAFDTPTGMPYGTVNLRYGVPPNETPVTCTAGVGTFVVEFGSLSRLTGDPIYEKVALRAMHALYAKRSALDLVGNHVDTQTGKWTAVDSGIGAGVDSYFEYLVKGSILFQRPELMHMFRVFHRAIEKHLGKGGWYVWATMGQGHVSATTFQSLETFFPGMLSLVGEFKSGLKAMTNYHRILKQYGGLPELYNILQGKATHQREGYPLRPELIESAMYLYRGTGDPYMLEIGEDILHSIQYNARTECGYATIRDVTTLTLEDRMESFFLAETVKYLYLLFDPDNFIHSEGEDSTVIDNPLGKCTVYAGGYIFNTEAHPIDPAALNCCTGVRESELHAEIQIIDEVRKSTKFTGQMKSKKLRSIRKKKIFKTQTSKPSLVEENSSNTIKNTKELQSSTSSSTPPKTLWKNPLLEFKSNMNITPRFVKHVKLDFSSITPTTTSSENNDESESLVYKLLKRLFEDQVENKELLEDLVEKQPQLHQDIVTGVEKGLKFVSANEAKDLQKLVENFETNLKTTKKQNRGVKQEIKTKTKLQAPEVIKNGKKENRIRSQVHGSPDLDLIFGTAAESRSLSFYFSLKWLRSFPDLIRHLIPSERFDIQAFYSRINQEFSPDGFVKEFNISRNWMSDYHVLQCPNIRLADRFMFFRSSVDD